MSNIPEQITALLARIPSGTTPGPLRLAIYDPDKDPVEIFRTNLSYGSGSVWGVMAPDHPLTQDGWADQPEHAVMVCVTGNGPASEANAALIALAPELRDAVVALAKENAELRTKLPKPYVEPTPDPCAYVGLDGAPCAGDAMIGGFCAAHDEEIYQAGGDNSPDGIAIIKRSTLTKDGGQ